MGLGAGLERLGSLCWRHAKIVILLWFAATLLAGSVARRIPERLLSGSGDIEGSASLLVDQTLRSGFRGNDGESLILTFRSASLDKQPVELSALVRRLNELLAQYSATGRLDEGDISNLGLAPKENTGHLIRVELRTKGLLAAEQQVPKVRAAVSALLWKAKARYDDLEWAVTGRAALTYDINRFSSQDTASSELRALPFTLAILILAFGSLVSAMLPLLLALVTRTVALGVIFLIAGHWEVSNLALSIVTMLAIALGIDYSLFLVHRYRRELVRIGEQFAGNRPADSQELAMCAAMRQSGAAVLYSALTVVIGMGALLATPLMQTRSIGLAGVFAVTIALLGSLTLVPAFLRLLRPSVLEWPTWFSRRMAGERSRDLWSRWAAMILRRPWIAIMGSLALLLALAAPALSTRFGFPEREFLPAELEYSRGLEMLEHMELKGIVSPIDILVTDTNGGNALSPERHSLLAAFVSRLEGDKRVRLVLGPVPSRPASPPASMEEAVGRAFARSAFISEDGNRMLFRVIPSDGSTLADLRALATHIPGWLPRDGLAVNVGGQAQYYNDFDRAVGKSYPMTIGLVLGMSATALLLFFRAPLAAAKAIVLNLFSVSAGYGVVVLVFQLGHGASLFGMTEGTAVVPITVPLVIFCILFGLSMDYEIFLLSRIRAIFSETGNTRRSIREALADTGSVITSAALVMVVVFGAFAFARIFIVQMIGLGLAVAVLVDATLIRSVLGPALMQVAGRWNWWPETRGAEREAA